MMQISITDGIIKQTITNVLLVGETKNDELYYSRNGRVPGSCSSLFDWLNSNQPAKWFSNKNLVDQYYRSICDRTRSSLWRKERLESTIDPVLESWNLWWLHNIFLFRVRNQSVDGTRIGLVGSTLCCIERDRSNGCSIRITVYSGKIRFHFDARRVTMRNRAYYHLPGLFEFYELYRVFLSLYREHREYFYDWCEIGSIYGAPSDCIWGGGRTSFGDTETEKVLDLMQEYKISARLTFSNSLLREEHLQDRKCNTLCSLLEERNEPQNGVIIHSDLLLNYLQKNYQLLFNHTFSTAWNLNVALHYTKGDGYYEEYKDGRSLIEYGLKPFTIDGTEITKSDLVRQKKMDNKFGGGVFSLNYTVNRLNASLGGGLNQYRGNNFGRVPWVKNYVGTLSPDHEYYRNKSKKTDGNIYLKANYDLTRGLSAYADLQYRHIDYTIDGNNDKYDWSKNALRPLAVDKKFDFFNPKVGLNWNITSNHRVYASFSVAQKEPTRNNYTDGDPDSYPKAEKLLDYEAGYTFANQWLTAGANFYYMDYTDQLVLTGALNDIGEALTENVPDSYRMGVELMLGIKPCKWFQWDINATWSKNRIQDFVESLPGYHYNENGSSTSLPTVQIKHKDTHIAFSPDFLFNNRFSFNYKGFEAALQSQFVSKQYMTNAEVEALTLDKYFVSNLNLAYSFRPKKVLKEVTVGFTVYNLFNEKYENNGWASSDYTDTVENRGNYAGYAAQAGTNVMGHVSFRF